MGREGLRERVKSCLESSHKLWHVISKLSNVRVLSRFPLCATEKIPITELAANPATSPVCFVSTHNLHGNFFNAFFSIPCLK